MALNNPINFFRNTETVALTKKGQTVGNNIATTSVTFVDTPDTSTKDAIAANEATGGGAIFIEGKKVIQGVSVPEKQYLWDQLAAKELAKYSAASISVSPNSGTWGFDTSSKDITFVFEARYNGASTNKVTTQTIGSSAGTAVSDKTGQYSKVITCSASNTGSQSVSATFTFTYNDTGYGTVTKSASATRTRYAKPVIISTTKGVNPTQSDITGATTAFSSDIKGTRTFTTTAGKDMWICTPAYQSYSTIKSGGFDVPFDAAIQVTVNGINYNCRRKTDTPSASTGTMTIVIA